MRERAYCRSSHFQVGSAILTKDGNVFIGCNVENRTFGLTVCAERVAGLGYGFAMRRTGSLKGAIAAHFAVNSIHFTLFTYPALA